MKVFLAHASQDDEVAEEIYLALRDHDVFIDSQSLPPGREYYERIKAAVDNADLFIFLISPDSVEPGRFTLTELEYARQRWPRPGDHVLPVVVRDVPVKEWPAYLRAATALTPKGNIAGEVIPKVAAMAASLATSSEDVDTRFPSRVIPAIVALAAVTGTGLLVRYVWFPTGPVPGATTTTVDDRSLQTTVTMAPTTMRHTTTTTTSSSTTTTTTTIPAVVPPPSTRTWRVVVKQLQVFEDGDNEHATWRFEVLAGDGSRIFLHDYPYHDRKERVLQFRDATCMDVTVPHDGELTLQITGMRPRSRRVHRDIKAESRRVTLAGSMPIPVRVAGDNTAGDFEFEVERATPDGRRCINDVFVEEAKVPLKAPSN